MRAEIYNVFCVGFREAKRQVAKYGEYFYELDDLSKHSGKPKKAAKPVKAKPFEKFEPVKT